MRKLLFILILTVAGAISFRYFNLLAPRSGLPVFIAWSSPAPGSQQFAQCAWFSNAFKRKYGVILHNMFSDGDQQVLAMLFARRVDFAVVGITGSYFAQEGLFPYADANEGPQPVRLVLANHAPFLRTLIVRAPSGIATAASLRAKRVAWTVRTPWINYLTLSLLRYGGVNAGDVRLVPVDTPENALVALIEGRVDAAFSPSHERVLYKASKGKPQAFKYLPLADGGDWNGVQQLAPFFSRADGTLGAGLSPAAPVFAATYAYPLIIARPDTGNAFAQHFTSALLETVPATSQIDEAMAGWKSSPLPLDWTVPYHEGSVAAFRRLGVWTPEHQKRNGRLIQRQRVLAKAWAHLKRKNVPAPEFENAWYEARAKALRKAGLEVGFFPSAPFSGVTAGTD